MTSMGPSSRYEVHTPIPNTVEHTIRYIEYGAHRYIILDPSVAQPIKVIPKV